MQDDERSPAGGPPVPVPGDDEEALSKACREDRDQMTPDATGDCAGLRLVEKYENDEDGGS